MSSLESTIEDLRPRTGQSATVAEARSALLMLAQVQKDNMEWTHSDSVLHVAHLMHRGSDWLFRIANEYKQTGLVMTIDPKLNKQKYNRMVSMEQLVALEDETVRVLETGKPVTLQLLRDFLFAA